MQSPICHLIDSADPARTTNPDRLLQLLERRWAMVIISRLCWRPLRFSELQRAIPEISTKMMVERLRELEDCGIVERSVLVKSARYSLTESGDALRPAVDALLQWARAGSGDGPDSALYGQADAADDVVNLSPELQSGQIAADSPHPGAVKLGVYEAIST